MQQVVDEDWIPDPEEIQDYAEYIGIDVANEKHLLWIAEEGLKAPLPDNWIAAKTDDGDVYYQNTKTKESSWDHPCDSLYQEKVIEQRKKGSQVKPQQSKVQDIKKDEVKQVQSQKPIVAEIPPFNIIQRNRAPSPESKIGFIDAPEVDMENIKYSANSVATNLQIDFSNEILKITNAHAEEIKIILKQQSNEISQLNRDHQQKIQQLENDNTREVRQIRNKHDEEIMSLKKQLNQEWIEVQHEVRKTQFQDHGQPDIYNQELAKSQTLIAAQKIQVADADKQVSDKKRELGQLQLDIEQLTDRITYATDQKTRLIQELEQLSHENMQTKQKLNQQVDEKMKKLQQNQTSSNNNVYDVSSQENIRLKRQIQEIYDAYEKLKNKVKTGHQPSDQGTNNKLQSYISVDAFSQLANTIIYTLPDPFRTRLLFMKYIVLLLSNGLSSIKHQIDLQIKSIEAKRSSFTAEQQLYQHSEDKNILQKLYKQRKQIDTDSQIVNQKVNDFRKSQEFLKQYRSFLNSAVKFISILSKGSQIIELCTEFYQQTSTSSFTELFNFAVDGEEAWIFPPLQQIDQTSRIEPQLENIRNQVISLLSNEDKRTLQVISDSMISCKISSNLENSSIFGIISSFADSSNINIEYINTKYMLYKYQEVPEILANIGIKQGIFSTKQENNNQVCSQDNKLINKTEQLSNQHLLIDQVVRQNDEWLNTFKKTMK
ncbi:WW domain-containing protein [Spironucleus salmonicida]|uniref:WW domain-containing protein n=1 Tax=Spironucleus salmonicida TaxID=348837 RepID=V6LU26_9EUKA|nr:WW domain-containing protein [Spironucleus salmonicida]|eukprot:EST47181.1 Hypothetical protein SS50377_12692 [Spironucleus salmonicida]